MWVSGLLAAATFMHLLRLMSGLPVTIGTFAVPLWVSGLIVPVAGGLSLFLIRKARGVG